MVGLNMRGITRDHGLRAFFLLAALVGIALRLTWNEDMEFKGDEHFMFDRSQRIGQDEPWPDLGMPSGVGLRNPGMSIWVFVVLARAFRATTPLGLDRAVVLVNCLAVAFAVWLAARIVPSEGKQREAWLWAAALAAVSPIALLLERKIWAQSVLPTLSVAFLLGWWRRDRWWGAALWGLVGAIVGQIHMSGFFFAAGFVLWEILLGVRTRRRTKWIAWVGASIVGAIPLWPWVKYVLSGQEHGPPWSWETVSTLRFFRHWVSDALGLGLDYSLGDQFWDFLRWPQWGQAKDLYPALYVQGIGFAVGVLVLAYAVARGWRDALAFRRWSPTAFTIGAGLLGYGLLITGASVLVWKHYLIVTFPLEWLTVAYLALRYVPRPRGALFALWAAQLFLSFTFLTYIHENGGAVRGDYGRAYSHQPHGPW